LGRSKSPTQGQVTAVNVYIKKPRDLSIKQSNDAS
jgi:hypothetical protein